MQKSLWGESETSVSITEQDKLHWLRLARTENVGPATFLRLVSLYGSPAEALKHLPDLAKRGGRKTPLIAPHPDNINKEYDTLRKLNGSLVVMGDTDYPQALRATDDPPPVISILGDIGLAHKSCIGIVGARNASLNGKKFAAKIAGDLGAQNQTIVSGLARGIDTAAHQGSLKTGTIAVVAGGIDIVYPEENRALYDQIKEGGLIIAESPLHQPPIAQSFPRRNRIVSGLSRGIVVVEATMRSGSLITARLAGEQGRELWAVPGHPLDPRAEGPNHLIREGATLVRSAADILESLLHFDGQHLRDIQSVQAAADFRMDIPDTLPDNAETTVMDNLSTTPCHVDELIRACGFGAGVMQTILLELELAGRLKRLTGNRVCLATA